MVGTGRFPTAELLVLCTRPLAKRLFGDSAALRRIWPWGVSWVGPRLRAYCLIEILSRREEMVGTGRFPTAELLVLCTRPLAKRLFVRLRYASSHTTWGASWVGPRRAYCQIGTVAAKRIMVGTGRFELPTPRTPSECSTRLSHVPTTRKSAMQEKGCSQRKVRLDYNICGLISQGQSQSKVHRSSLPIDQFQFRQFLVNPIIEVNCFAIPFFPISLVWGQWYVSFLDRLRLSP